MQKKIGLLFLVLSMAACVGCGKDESKADVKNDTKYEASVEQAEKETEIPEVEGGVSSAEDIEFEEEAPVTVLDEFADSSKETDAVEENTKENEILEETKQDSGSSKNHAASGSSNVKEDAGLQEPELDSKTENNTPETEKPTVEKQEKPQQSEIENESEEEISYMTYEEFQKLSPGEQQKYMETFGDIAAFFDWYNEAKAEYEKDNSPIIVGGEGIDMEELLGGE